jgi:hypothetical protein
MLIWRSIMLKASWRIIPQILRVEGTCCDQDHKIPYSLAGEQKLLHVHGRTKRTLVRCGTATPQISPIQYMQILLQKLRSTCAGQRSSLSDRVLPRMTCGDQSEETRKHVLLLGLKPEDTRGWYCGFFRNPAAVDRWFNNVY